MSNPFIPSPETERAMLEHTAHAMDVFDALMRGAPVPEPKPFNHTDKTEDAA